MQIRFETSPNFGRRLNSSEEAEYKEILKKGKEKASGSQNGKSILIVPSTSLPNSLSESTGVGLLNQSGEFFDFAKKYWGINEVQILPSGQYHAHKWQYPFYSGTTMDLGNHLIDVKSLVSKEDFQKIVDANKTKDKVNFSNVVDLGSTQEEVLKNLHKNITPELKSEFEKYKLENNAHLEPKGLYRALREIYGEHNYNHWNELDRNLFNEDLVSEAQRAKRIREIYAQKSETIDFYKFKQFLAEKSLKQAKDELNKKGIKLNGDMACGFSFDEVWSHPKAFHNNSTIGWGMPALNLDSKEAENLIREKSNLYARRFDGIRVDAAWTYVAPPVKDELTGAVTKKDYGAKFLDIIDDEVKKVKGNKFNRNDVMHEFAASAEDFNAFEGSRLKPYIEDRVKIYTSDWLSDDWGSADNFKRRGWSQDKFIIGATNHDSAEIKYAETQAESLGKILNIKKEKLKNPIEFLKAKLAEPFGAKNNMVFFMQALGLEGKFKGNSNPSDNYTAKIPENYEEVYIENLQKGKALNPMDALEKQFKAQGLDKTEPELYKKIVKYRKILEQKGGKSSVLVKAGAGIVCAGLIMVGLYKYYSQNKQNCRS